MTFAELIVDQIIFFAICDDSEADPDTAVGQFEGLIAGVQELPLDDLASVLAVVADRMGTATGPTLETLVETAEMLEEVRGRDVK